MKRTPIRSMSKKRLAKLHEPRVDASEHPKALTPATRSMSYSGSTSGKPVVKEKPVRSEAYRRLVAAMPCADCGRPGPSQAAHPNTGKGMALKVDDRRCFPMCPDCHRDLDQGGTLSKPERRTFEEQAERETRAAITAAGLWPKNLPKYEEN